MVVQTHQDLTRALADALGFDGRLRSAPRRLLPRQHLCFLGFGSVARPMAERAFAYGAVDFTLVDPKQYAARSVASQCAPEEVGRLKVAVGKERLADRGARVTAYARDLCEVPDGAVHANSVLVVSADNRRADIGANRLAVRMRAPLVKVNVEPAYGVVAVRAFDFRRPSPVCVECSFSAATYARQRHPRSCDGGDERPTGSPRILSRAAAELGAMAVLETVDESRSAAWFSREMLFSLETGRVTWSELTPNRDCRCDHAQKWPALQRLASGPEALSLAELTRIAGIVVGETAGVRFCRQVSLQSHCAACGCQSHRPHWLAGLDAPAGDCPRCGGPLTAVPFYVHGEVPLTALRDVLDEPLASWGVAPAAVIELSGAAERRAFVVGSDRARAVPAFADRARTVPVLAPARTGLSPSPRPPSPSTSEQQPEGAAA